jgi:hypothetical protein
MRGSNARCHRAIRRGANSSVSPGGITALLVQQRRQMPHRGPRVVHQGFELKSAPHRVLDRYRQVLERIKLVIEP